MQRTSPSTRPSTRNCSLNVLSLGDSLISRQNEYHLTRSSPEYKVGTLALRRVMFLLELDSLVFVIISCRERLGSISSLCNYEESTIIKRFEAMRSAKQHQQELVEWPQESVQGAEAINRLTFCGGSSKKVRLIIFPSNCCFHFLFFMFFS